MSALGQKQKFREVETCQLYHRKRTLGLSRAISAKCEKADILLWGKNVVA